MLLCSAPLFYKGGARSTKQLDLQRLLYQFINKTNGRRVSSVHAKHLFAQHVGYAAYHFFFTELFIAFKSTFRQLLIYSLVGQNSFYVFLPSSFESILKSSIPFVTISAMPPSVGTITGKPADMASNAVISNVSIKMFYRTCSRRYKPRCKTPKRRSAGINTYIAFHSFNRPNRVWQQSCYVHCSVWIASMRTRICRNIRLRRSSSKQF